MVNSTEIGGLGSVDLDIYDAYPSGIGEIPPPDTPISCTIIIPGLNLRENWSDSIDPILHDSFGNKGLRIVGMKVKVGMVDVFVARTNEPVSAGKP